MNDVHMINWSSLKRIEFKDFFTPFFVHMINWIKTQKYKFENEKCIIQNDNELTMKIQKMDGSPCKIPSVPIAKNSIFMRKLVVSSIFISLL